MNAAKSNASMLSMMNMSAPLDPIVLQALPKGPIMLSSEGNMFEIVIESRNVKVNGLALVPFAVLTGLHGKFSEPISKELEA
jgi:L-lysine 2,3-aminomutase